MAEDKGMSNIEYSMSNDEVDSCSFDFDQDKFRRNDNLHYVGWELNIEENPAIRHMTGKSGRAKYF
jgi:hypothetical protein